MVEIIQKAAGKSGITDAELLKLLEKSIQDRKAGLKKVLLLPPDFTRMHSGAGKITAMYYELLKDTCQVDIMPALGTHDPMSEAECREFFGEKVPLSNIVVHNWRTEVVKIGEVPGEYVREVSEGLLDFPVNAEVELSWKILDPVLDYWAKPSEILAHRAGDCEDFAILKMAALLRAGIPAQSMSLVVLQDRRRKFFHAVLSVSTSLFSGLSSQMLSITVRAEPSALSTP